MFQRLFTMVELLIVVSIVAILASIAVPIFWEMQLEAKVAEGYANAESVLNAQIAFEAAQDGFAVCDKTPSALPGKAGAAWAPTDPDWDDVGWEPDGDVRCTYETLVPTTTEVQVQVECDVDGDVSSGGDFVFLLRSNNPATTQLTECRPSGLVRTKQCF